MTVTGPSARRSGVGLGGFDSALGKSFQGKCRERSKYRPGLYFFAKFLGPFAFMAATHIRRAKPRNLMSLSNDPLAALLARRSDIYEQLRLVDGHAAAVRNSPFFNTRLGNAVTMVASIERMEAQIGEINRKIARIRGRGAAKPALPAPAP